MKHISKIAIVSAVLAASASAQDWVHQTVERSFDRALVQREDGEMVVLGSVYQEDGLRVDIYTPSGASQAAFKIESDTGEHLYGNDACIGADDSLVVVGLHTSLQGGLGWVSSWDLDSGTRLWETLPLQPEAVDLNGGEFKSVVAIPGGYLAGGGTFDVNLIQQAVVVALDESGALLWKRKIGQFTGASSVEAIVSTDDGGAVLAISDEGKALFVRISSVGSPLWSRRFPGIAGYDLHAARASDGEILVSSYDSQNSQKTWVAKLSLVGDVVWQKTYSTSGIPEALAPAADGGAFLALSVGPDPALLRIDSQGDVRAMRRLPAGAGHGFDASILPHPDGGAHISWSEGDFGAPDNFLARYGAQDLGNVCSGALSAIDSTASDAAYFAANAVSQVNVILGGPASGLSTKGTGAGLTLVNYCGGKCTYPPTFCTSSPNSVGAGARIDSNGGSMSVFANDFELIVRDVPASTPGVFIYGQNPDSVPFGEGVLCLAPPLVRMSPDFSTSTGEVTKSVDLTTTDITAGSTWYFQLWYRDPVGGGSGFNLSDGLTTTWCP